MKKVKVSEYKIYDRLIYLLTDLSLIRTIADEISKLVAHKNTQYGDAWQRWGVFTPLVRINDKILRLATLSGIEESDKRHALTYDESVKDTLRDIIGYATLALLWLEENQSGDMREDFVKWLLEEEDTDG